MAFISKKKLKGIDRYYLEKSIRMPDGKVKKNSIYLKGYNPKKKADLSSYYQKLDQTIVKKRIEYVIELYEQDHIFNPDLIKRIEEIKIDYEKIKSKFSKKQMQDIVDRFTANFTYESNAIEGNSLTLKDVTLLLQEKKVVKGKDLREIYETLNTRKAMEFTLNKKVAVNEKNIIKLHQMLVKNTGIAKGYKKFPNFLLGKALKTCPPEHVQQEMKKIIDWYNQSKHIHPIKKIAIFHGKFERIHPFEDGNGRVGRMLINIMLKNHNYPPLIIRKSQRISYFNCLEAFDKGHRDKLIRFLIEKYKKTYENFFKIYIKYI